MNILPQNDILSYADDTVIFGTGKDWKAAQENMMLNLNIVHNWLAQNQLSLNVEKTYITFGLKINSVPKNIVININNKPIKRVLSTKYLGIIIDCHLRWDVHVQSVINKTRYLLYIFRKISTFMSNKTMMIIYYTLYHSITNYGIVAWGECMKMF